jgi:hypothetical protein
MDCYAVSGPACRPTLCLHPRPHLRSCCLVPPPPLSPPGRVLPAPTPQPSHLPYAGRLQPDAAAAVGAVQHPQGPVIHAVAVDETPSHSTPRRRPALRPVWSHNNKDDIRQAHMVVQGVCEEVTTLMPSHSTPRRRPALRPVQSHNSSMFRHPLRPVYSHQQGKNGDQDGCPSAT